MKKMTMLLAAALLATGLSGCGSGDSGSEGAQTRTVQVDYRHDEFETAMLEYYPKAVTIRPGDTVEFKQAWTGEPHSVTMGALLEPKLVAIVDFLKGIQETGEIPKEEPKVFEEFDFPYTFDEGEDGEEVLAQNAAQPCYVDEATEYPGDVDTPCPKRAQPEFTGRQAIYNSGLIPYEGVKGNSFVMKIADDATPGKYTYYCNVHGGLQYGEITIASKGSEIPSKAEVAKQARVEAEQGTSELLKSWKDASAGKAIKFGDPGVEKTLVTKGKRLVGVPTLFFKDKKFIHGVINEFVPRNVTAKVGEKLTWTFDSGHTLSFNVPSYFPIFTVDGNGTVQINKKTGEPVGFPGPPEEEKEEDGPPSGEEGGPPEGEGGPPDTPKEPVRIDAGAWDGKGFRSTGLDYESGTEFSVAFTKAGTYSYACLIHPKMVGKLTVK